MPAADAQMPRRDVLDAAPQDGDLLEEIQLLSELMVAASNSPRQRLPRQEVDDILGLSPAHPAIPTQGDGSDRTPAPARPRATKAARSR